PPPRGRLQSLEFIPVGPATMFFRMGAAGTVFGGEVWAFEMNAQHGLTYVSVRLASFVDRSHAVGETSEALRGQRGTDSCHAEGKVPAYDAGNLFGRQFLRAEFLAFEAINLHIDEAWGYPGQVVLRLMAGRKRCDLRHTPFRESNYCRCAGVI